MTDLAVSSEQRVRLLELEARQKQLKRLCEEALRQDEEHQHIFQQLEEHNMASSTVNSLRGTGSASGGAATQQGRTAATASLANDDPMDDLLTGEVRSFRDPNSATRASSTGSVAGAAAAGGGCSSGSHPRKASVDRPAMTRLDSAFLPPTFPTAGVSTAAPNVGPMPPPPPPRATLYGATRQPRANTSGPARPSFSGIPSPIQPSTTARIPPSWKGDSNAGAESVRPTLSSAQSGLKGTAAATRPLKYTPPILSSSPPLTSPSAPPPPPERSRSPSHSMPLADLYQNSGSYIHHVLPPPPPPPSPALAEVRVSPYSVKYESSSRSRVGLTSPAAVAPPPRISPLPPPTAAPSNLISPDEMTDNLPQPPPRRRDVFSTPDNHSRDAVSHHSPPLVFKKGLSLQPPPPPSPPGASEHSNDDGCSILSTTSTERDLARWRHRLRHADTHLQRSTSAYASSAYAHRREASATSPTGTTRDYAGAHRGSWAAAQNLFSATQRGLDRRLSAAAAPGFDKKPQKRGHPPPPPPPPESPSGDAGILPPSRNDDEGDHRSSRWETASLTPSLKRAEEVHLRNYFASDEKVSPRSLKEYTSTNHRTSPSKWMSAARGYRARQQGHPQQNATSVLEEWDAASHLRAPASDGAATVLHYDASVMEESTAASVAKDATHCSPPPLPPRSATEKEFVPSAGGASAAPKARKRALHPYGGQPMAFSKPPMAPNASSTSPAAPLFPTLYAQQQQQQQSSSTGLNSTRSSVWASDAPPQHVQTDLNGGAGGGSAMHSVAVVSGNEFFDMGPEKEALLTLLRESTRTTAAAATNTTAAEASVQPEMRSEVSPSISRPDVAADAFSIASRENPPLTTESDVYAAKPLRELNKSLHSTSPKPLRRPPNTGGTTGSFLDASGGTLGLPPRSGDASAQQINGVSSEPAPSAAARRPSPKLSVVDSASPQLQRQCEEAQAKAEALARHLVKAIADRKLLQSNVEELEQMVEECNAEVGRMQRTIEQQHQDASTSSGIQAALRAKEREVAVYEDEIRRLHGVLEDHLERTSATKQHSHDGLSQSLITREAEIAAAMTEVGAAHLAQRDAEERANQLANELETAVEQIQFLDERLAEMERAAAAAQFENLSGRIRSGDSLVIDDALDTPAGATLTIPSSAETQHWPVEARRAMAQLIAQAQGLLLHNAEGERHAAMRLQHMEQTCNELQEHLRQRGEEVERTQEACQQLRLEKSALRVCGEQWYRQLRDVKEDAQLVSEMIRTARSDAEDVYLSSRVAQERVAEQQAAAAAASPFRPTSTIALSSSAVDAATLQKSAQFAQQVMGDFHAVARFLSSLRKMEIGDRNGYHILQSIASGRSPAEGLFITADDAATPKRMLEHLPEDATTEAKRRVQEKKLRVLQAVERALSLEAQPDTAPGYISNQSRSHVAPSAVSERPPMVIPLGLPPRAGAERTSTVIEIVTAGITPGLGPEPVASAEVDYADELGSFPVEMADELEPEPEVEVVTTALKPLRINSNSYRGGSSGMVHSDMRRPPAGLDPSTGHSSSQMTPLMPHAHPSANQSITTPTSSSATSRFTAAAEDQSKQQQPHQQQRSALPKAASSPVPLRITNRPLCSTLYMGDGTEPPRSFIAGTASGLATSTSTKSSATAAAVPLTPPPPSVSRPLRLSTTPSQPQSEVNEERETSSVEPQSAPDMGAGDTIHSIIINTRSTPLRGSVSEIDREASSTTGVSSPSLTPQASDQTLQKQLQQSLQCEEAEMTASLPPSVTTETVSITMRAPTAVVTPSSSTQRAATLIDTDTAVPSVSGIASYGEEGIHPTHPEGTTKQLSAPHTPKHQQNHLKDDTPLLSRLRSPTPDGPSLRHELLMTAAPDALMSSPLGCPPPSQSFVDEPPPRAVQEESQPLRTGSYPKDRSTTARPPSSPPARLHNTRSEPGIKGRDVKNANSGHGTRRAASDNSSDDEATSVFRDPPPGSVREVLPVAGAAAPPLTHGPHSEGTVTSAEAEPRVAVHLLRDDFVMPSQRAGTATALEPKATVANANAEEPGAPAQRTPTEADLSAHALPLSSSLSKGESTATGSAVSNAGGGKSKERSRTPRSRRVVDDDDEPSLQFSAPPPLPMHPLLSPATLPRPANIACVGPETDKNASSLSHEATLCSTSLPRASAASTDREPSTFSPTTQIMQPHRGPANRQLHHPRLPQSIDAGPSLSATCGGVAAPRLQRSASASPAGPAPLAGPSAPGPAGLVGSRPDLARRSVPSSSVDGPNMGVTPMLAEPQRISKASRSDMTTAPSSAAGVAEPDPARTSPASARVSTGGFEEEEVEVLGERSATATPNRATSRDYQAVRVNSALQAPERATVLAAEDDLTGSDSQISTNALHEMTSHHLSSDAATATPGSPLRSEKRDTPSSQPYQKELSVGPAAVVAAAASLQSLPRPRSSTGIGLPHTGNSDTIGSFSMGMSQPADPLPAAPGQPRELPGRAAESRSGATSSRLAAQQRGLGSSEPAPLPTVNVDAPESNTLGLRRASPMPAASPTLSDAPLIARKSSTPAVTDVATSTSSSVRSRSGQTEAHNHSDSAASGAGTKRREEVARILERIRVKREQELKPEADSPTTATAASLTSSLRHDSEDASFTEE
ncbi:hypothetical protein ABL78_6631 [Leptomonas seymouri]|uniref:Uncharacterized protein n=1 Tax=Leptomonas seymouri TaxID=5684 RepID=A0A0N1PAI7_LEPSE|nr:hypothetical protein ABL78_6631 [Leptomonas seymouri]|eukprot:KPI84308.1 hypothetical protein ABL78_6631 [Leptomonas seymouri]